MSTYALFVSCSVVYIGLMARELEDARAAGLIDTYSADEAVGIVVDALMFRHRKTRKELGAALGITGQVASRKVRGEVTWSITDVLRAADFLGVDPVQLLPKPVGEAAHRPEARAIEGKAGFEPAPVGSVVGRAGLEPATKGL